MLATSSFIRPGKLGHALKLNRCIADSDTSIVILPDGHVGKCEHFSDCEWFMSVLDPEEKVDEAKLRSFFELRPEIEDCATCPLYPECYRLVICAETIHCYPEEQKLKLFDIRQQMLSYYGKHKV